MTQPVDRPKAYNNRPNPSTTKTSSQANPGQDSPAEGEPYLHQTNSWPFTKKKHVKSQQLVVKTLQNPKFTKVYASYTYLGPPA